MGTEDMIKILEQYIKANIRESINIQNNMRDRGLNEYENIMRGKVSAYQDILDKLDGMRDGEELL